MYTRNDSLQENSPTTLCIWWQTLIKESQPISDAFFFFFHFFKNFGWSRILGLRHHFGFAFVCQASSANFPDKLDRWRHIRKRRGRLGTRLGFPGNWLPSLTKLRVLVMKSWRVFSSVNYNNVYGGWITTQYLSQMKENSKLNNGGFNKWLEILAAEDLQTKLRKSRNVDFKFSASTTGTAKANAVN